MRNIFLFMSCMVVFLSIIGCSIELKEEKTKEEKCYGYTVKRNDNDPGLVYAKEELKGAKSPTEVKKALNNTFDKVTTVHVAVALYDMRAKVKKEAGEDATGDEAEAQKLIDCIVDKGERLHKYTLE